MEMLKKTVKAAPPSKVKQRTSKSGYRTYEVETAEGEIYNFPSVTTILSVVGKPALINWAANVSRDQVLKVAADLYTAIRNNPPMNKLTFEATLKQWLGKDKAHEKELARAGDIGRQLHKRIEWIMRGELGQVTTKEPPLSTDAQKAFQQWVAWRSQVNLRPILVEQQVYSLEYGYAGMLDLYGEIDGELSVIDWKSGKAIYPEHPLQNAAYRLAFEEMGHGKVQTGHIIRLPKTKSDTFEVMRIGNDRFHRDFSVFLNVMRLWEYLQNGKRQL